MTCICHMMVWIHRTVHVSREHSCLGYSARARNSIGQDVQTREPERTLTLRILQLVQPRRDLRCVLRFRLVPLPASLPASFALDLLPAPAGTRASSGDDGMAVAAAPRQSLSTARIQSPTSPMSLTVGSDVTLRGNLALVPCSSKADPR